MSGLKFNKMVRSVVEWETVSIARIQRTFSIGYARAASVVDVLESKGLIECLEDARKKYNLNKIDEIKQVFSEELSFLLKEKKIS